MPSMKKAVEADAARANDEDKGRQRKTKQSGSPKVAAGSPKVAAGSPKVAAGSPKVTAGSPEVTAGSPEVTAGSPEVAANQIVEFKKLCYDVRASSVYNEQDVVHALKEAAAELIGNAKESGTYFVRESYRLSNYMIVFGWIAIASGLYCFRLQYNKENKKTIALTAALYWVVAVSFFIIDFACTDKLVSAFRLSKKKTDYKSNAIYLHYEPEQAMVRWVTTNQFSYISSLKGGITRCFRLKSVPYIRGLLYVLEKIQPHSAAKFNVGKRRQQAIELPKGMDPVDISKSVISVLESGVVPINKKTDDKEQVGILLERDVTHYFDDQG
ncbi:putative transmembrane protein [Gregarina niphandrodes]|uniref:Transmembrane protein n=1 Tax=Gregarina niphandrodes TaxID=110365 RepID=A0A023B8M7_GRENI|nr:putative transmembrane protein [Gregarina niphandrodes]EZG69285.1 putative transmembrane protein [Gregarina niphandrodes]|eukprot:XP_011134448.1 putative transmembrane protein [Gregarina niphandrodes]